MGVAVACTKETATPETEVKPLVAAPSGQPEVDFVLRLPPNLTLGQVVLAANGTVNLADRVRVNAPAGLSTISNMGLGGTTLGVTDQVGNIVSKGQVHLRNYAVAAGDVTTSRPVVLDSGARIDGDLVENASFDPPTIIKWKVKYPDTSAGDVYVPPNGRRTIAPGRYTNFTVQAGGKLTLQSGTYYIETLDLEPGTELLVNKASGSVVLYARGSIIYRGTVRDIGGAQPDFLCAYMGSNAVYLERAFKGSIFAPNARLVLAASGVVHAGAFYGKDLEVYPNVTVQQKPVVIDSDNDGLTFQEEVDTYHTDPFRADTDDDGLKDGDEVAYWKSRTDGITWSSDVEPMQRSDGQPGDGLTNVLDPDSDNDGVLDGEEVMGWDIIVGGATKRVYSDPSFADSDGDLIPDQVEHDGWEQEIHHVIRTIRTDPTTHDTDGDGLADAFERSYGLDATHSATMGYMNDLEWWSIMLNIGAWATKPFSAHLDPRHSPTDAAVLVFEKDFLADTATELKVGGTMDFSIYIPAARAGTPITLQLDFLGPDDPNDKFSGVIYGKPQTPGHPEAGHIVASATLGSEGNHLSWTISDSALLTEGDWWFTVSHTYDKDAGETPRTMRIQVRHADNSYAKMIYICEQPVGPHHTTYRYTYTSTGGAVPTFFRGETIIQNGTGSSFVDNLKVTDAGGALVREIGKKAFNGYSFQYPLGSLASYDPVANDLSVLNKVVYDWTFDSGIASRFMTHIDEVGDAWSGTQVTYDVAYHTNQYESWSGGLASSRAVVRRGTPVRVVATSSVLSSQDAAIVVKNLAGVDVTSSLGFAIAKESGYEDYAAYDGSGSTWRENWIVGVPAGVPVGRYTIEMSAGSFNGSAELYVLFDPYVTALPEDERRAYAYDKDSNGYFFGGDDNGSRDTVDRWTAINSPNFMDLVYDLTPQTQAVVDVAVTVVSGQSDPHLARDAIRNFVGNYIRGYWGSGATLLHPSSVLSTITNATYGITREMVANGLWPATLPQGQCMDFGGVSTALARAVGLPTRLASAQEPFRPSSTTYQPTTSRWNFHVWSETWVATPHTGTDPWYAYDATDYAGSATGSSASRVDFGALWDPVGVWVGDTTPAMPRVPVTSAY